MIHLLGSPRRFCDGITRRDALAAGSLSLLAGYLGLPALPAAASDRVGTGRARSVVFLFLHGGAPTQDMFDLKPDAPPEVRGEFKPVATSAPGVKVCEHLPKTAKW